MPSGGSHSPTNNFFISVSPKWYVRVIPIYRFWETGGGGKGGVWLQMQSEFDFNNYLSVQQPPKLTLVVWGNLPVGRPLKFCLLLRQSEEYCTVCMVVLEINICYFQAVQQPNLWIKRICCHLSTVQITVVH